MMYSYYENIYAWYRFRKKGFQACHRGKYDYVLRPRRSLYFIVGTERFEVFTSGVRGLLLQLRLHFNCHITHQYNTVFTLHPLLFKPLPLNILFYFRNSGVFGNFSQSGSG